MSQLLLQLKAELKNAQKEEEVRHILEWVATAASPDLPSRERLRQGSL